MQIREQGQQWNEHIYCKQQLLCGSTNSLKELTFVSNVRAGIHVYLELFQVFLQLL